MRNRLLIQIEKGLTLSGGGLRQPIRATPRDDRELVEMVSELLTTRPGKRRHIVVELGRPRLQIRTLTGLPLMRKKDLERLVANQPDRFFRVKGVPITTAARWVAGSTGAAPRAIAIAAPERILCDLAGLAAQHQASSFAVRPLLESPLRNWSLLPAALRVEEKRRVRRRALRLGAIAVAAWCTVAVVRVATLYREEGRLRGELAALRPAADSAVTLRRSLGALREAIGLASQWDQTRGAPLRVLATVAGALPPEAFISRLRLGDSGAVEIEGAAAQPALVLAAMRDEARFEQVEFGRPAVERLDLAGRALTRFQLHFKAGHP